MNPAVPLVVIPAFNEEATVAAVIGDVRRVLGCDVVVVDDGSTDATAERARAAGAVVLRLPFNLGVGGAIRTGLRYASERGYGSVLQLDGDGQHDAADARRLLDELAAGRADLVIGARFATGYDVAWPRRLAMRLLARIVSRRVGARVTDTTSGFRAMGPGAVRLFASRYPVDYLSDTVEALLLAGQSGLRVREVDVRMRPRQGGVPSSSAVRSGYHFGRLLLGIALRGAVRRRVGSART